MLIWIHSHDMSQPQLGTYCPLTVSCSLLGKGDRLTGQEREVLDLFYYLGIFSMKPCLGLPLTFAWPLGTAVWEGLLFLFLLGTQDKGSLNLIEWKYPGQILAH